jgi:hypothetical protein
MAYGLETYGHNGSLSFNTDWPSLQYFGKATRVTGTGLTFFNNDSGSLRKRTYIPGNTYNQLTSIAGTGVRQIVAQGWCGNATVNLTIPNDNGVYTYSIACPESPQVFTYTSNQDISATILSVVNSGTTSAGMIVWYIKIIVNYPVGMRDAALPYLTFYCFSKIKNEPATDYGINTFNSSGILTYSSSVKTLRVKDMVTIASTTLTNPANLGSLLINDTTEANPVVPWNLMSKPTFLNIDWARYLWQQSFYMGNIAYGYDTTYGECENYGPMYCYFKQGFLVGGVRPNTSRTARLYGLSGIDVTEWGTTQTTDVGTSVQKIEAQFPVYIPVIDGADYD